MKKLLFIIAIVALFSCEKDPTYCWQCNKEIYVPNAYSSVVQIICDKTESDIRAFEQDQSREMGAAVIIMTCRLYK